MSLKYHLVQRKDMRKGAAPNAQLYYGQIRTQGKLTFDKLCQKVSNISTASKGDVQLVISGLLNTLTEYLELGFSIKVGELGTFRMSVGSEGTDDKAKFNTALFKKPRVIFTPGSMLRTLVDEVGFDKMLEKEVECDKLHVE